MYFIIIKKREHLNLDSYRNLGNEEEDDEIDSQ